MAASPRRKRVVAQCMLSGDLSDTLERPPDEGNHKAALQEWLQARQRELPQYAVVRTEGSDKSTDSLSSRLASENS